VRGASRARRPARALGADMARIGIAALAAVLTGVLAVPATTRGPDAVAAARPPTAVSPPPAPPGSAQLLPGPSLPPGTAVLSPAPEDPLASLPSLKLVSYFPAQAAWTNMWTRWDPAQLEVDFGRIAALRANTVRVVVPPAVFGYPTPIPAMQARLAEAVAAAAGHGLRVQLTLFDWWNGYDDLAGSDAWSAAVLAPFRSDPRIAFVELQNEITAAGPAGLAWARHELPVVKAAAGTVPVTASVSSLDGLRMLRAGLSATPPDLYDLHYYGPPGLAFQTFAAARAIVAPAPLVIGETGYSTARVGPGDEASAEAAQDAYLGAVEWATVVVGLPPAGVWTLNDFAPSAVPASVRDPATESGFGLYAVDGRAKPAAATVATFFATGVVDRSINGGFEAGSGDSPRDWQRFRPDMGRLAWDHGVSRTGTASVRLSATSGDRSGTAAWFATPLTSVPSPGRAFRATAWARGSGATGDNRVAIAWFDASSRYLGQAESPGLPAGSPGWTPLAVTSRAPRGAVYAEVFLKSSHNRGTVWFDDVAFTPLS